MTHCNVERWSGPCRARLRADGTCPETNTHPTVNVNNPFSTPTDAQVAAGAAKIHDMLTMLGVDPDETFDAPGGTTAEIIARAVLVGSYEAKPVVIRPPWQKD